MASRILDTIDAPSDLRALSYAELDQVAQEARDTIISVITERGGHLASNLGVVELTLALHRVFDSPRDSLVWDTTNQTYTHKLVTGRRDDFQNIRLEGGLSGFGEPSESPHDTLCAGHTGTGLSIALGFTQMKPGEPFAFAGLWDSWQDPEGEDGVEGPGTVEEVLDVLVDPEEDVGPELVSGGVLTDAAVDHQVESIRRATVVLN